MHGEVGAIQSAIIPRQETRAVADSRPVFLVAQRTEAFGDAILRIPTYRAIRCAFPSHRIVSVCRGHSVFSSVLSHLRPLFIDELFERQRKNGRTYLTAVARTLGKVDAIIDFDSNLQSVVNYLATLGISKRYVANVVGLALRRGLPWGLEARPSDNAHRYHRLVELIAQRTLPFDASLPVLPRAQAQIDALLPRDQRYFGIAPGRPTSPKYWPLERHIAVARRIRDMGIRPVFLLGPYPDECEQRKFFQSAIPEAIVIDKDVAGGDQDYLPWLFHAAATRFVGCLGIDGGICHLLATHNIPVATLAGPMPVRAWKPVTQQSWIVDARRFGSRAMDAIPVEAVAGIVDEMLAWVARREKQALQPQSV
jgi:ADP-heptose:LPS heptosyltransferase